ncbi:mechanosensitive ion channel family protein [Catenovulum sp. SM1970]|uniref:mechanosensitive ion channel family protein n=1 Tax=Marinifaba aquimaris TaxID=2741323 RepID=UPI0015720395|nr:mechanosensitive ion channel family protein [Marinifaba aquimaris]NTS78786.1 mechanosensitive ion channel family protein [Marinifaba aquimaris]
MQHGLVDLIAGWGLPASLVSPLAYGAALLLSLLSAFLVFVFVKHGLLKLLQSQLVVRRSQWLTKLEQFSVFRHIALLAPLIALWFIIPKLWPAQDVSFDWFLLSVEVLICLQVAVAVNAIVSAVYHLYQDKTVKYHLGLHTGVQLFKLVIFLVAIILAISLALGKSPIYLLSGLGALTAVLLLIFQDTIKGTVASIEITVNDLVCVGDWITVEKYGADGDVLEIGLNTVKVKNFDNTITTIPTYALTSHSFKNWRNMSLVGARRIKRSLLIDVNSVGFLSESQLNKLTEFKLLKDYLIQKQATQAMLAEQEQPVNSTRLTNIGVFRFYIENYLRTHPHVHPDATCMVRQLDNRGEGIPLEIYCFTHLHKWIEYEGVQSDIFDHLYAIAAEFDIKLFQQPTGLDWRQAS